MSMNITKTALSEMERVRRLLLKSYLYFTNQINSFCAGMHVPDIETTTARASYSAEKPRAVLIQVEGKLPPSLNATLDFGCEEDRDLWFSLKTWWHTVLSKPFASRGGRFPHFPLQNPIIFASISATGKIYDLDNYGVKAVIDALESIGVIQRDGDIEWFAQRRIKGSPEIELIVTESNQRLESSLFDVYRLVRSRTFEPIKGQPANGKTGNSGEEFYS